MPESNPPEITEAIAPVTATSDQEFEQICYKRNFLNEVIARADFVAPLADVDSKLPTNFTDVAMKRFPIFEPQARFETQFEVKGLPASVTTKERSYTDWTFHGKNREKSLTLNPKSLVIQYKKYQRFEDLSDDFSTVFNSLCTSFPDSRVSRLGLRYINTLNLEHLQTGSVLDWSKYLHGDLLGLFRFAGSSNNVSRVFHNIEYTHEDAQVRFQFGMHNPDYPATIRRYIFILDFDAFTEGLIEATEVEQRLLRFHRLIQTLFEQSILQPLRDQLNA